MPELTTRAHVDEVDEGTVHVCKHCDHATLYPFCSNCQTVTGLITVEEWEALYGESYDLDSEELEPLEILYPDSV